MKEKLTVKESKTLENCVRIGEGLGEATFLASIGGGLVLGARFMGVDTLGGLVCAFYGGVFGIGTGVVVGSVVEASVPYCYLSAKKRLKFANEFVIKKYS